MEKKNLVYIVVDADGNKRANYSTGTSIYSRKANAIARLGHYGSKKVVEFELVPTGEEWTK